MPVNLRGRSLLTLLEMTPSEVRYLLDLARKLGATPNRRRFVGKTLAMIFEKTSTRTRCAFESAFAEEGGHPIFLNKNDIQLGAKETVEDTARVLGRMVDAIQFRGFQQSTVEALAAYSGVPVYNGLTDDHHPTQALADLMTLEQCAGRLAGARLVFVGDGRNNVSRSLLIGCAQMGVHYTVASPRKLALDSASVEKTEALRAKTGATYTAVEDPREAVRGADAVYTDVWASMGEESKLAQRIRQLKPYQVNKTLMDATDNPRAVFLHCLPAVRGNEVTAEVIDGGQSRVWDQAENRKHTIKALMVATLA